MSINYNDVMDVDIDLVSSMESDSSEDYSRTSMSKKNQSTARTMGNSHSSSFALVTTNVGLVIRALETSTVCARLARMVFVSCTIA
jgi:hypothetical protein